MAIEIYEPLARELAAQQQLLDSGYVEPTRKTGDDAHLLDVAAHWMEIRSGREDILHK